MKTPYGLGVFQCPLVACEIETSDLAAAPSNLSLVREQTDEFRPTKSSRPSSGSAKLGRRDLSHLLLLVSLGHPRRANSFSDYFVLSCFVALAVTVLILSATSSSH
jgi:hypothetical protein